METPIFCIFFINFNIKIGLKTQIQYGYQKEPYINELDVKVCKNNNSEVTYIRTAGLVRKQLWVNEYIYQLKAQSILIRTKKTTMDLTKSFKIRCSYSSVIESILNSIVQITTTLQHTPVIVLETVNKFGDQQLHLDVHCDEVVQKHLALNPSVRGIASEERPEYIELSQGEGGYDITYDPLDGSSIVDTNFSVGSIFSIWPHDQDKLIGKKLNTQVNAVLAIYGPRTTVILYNPEVDKVQQLTQIDGQWILSHEHCVIKEKTNIFSPGNLRAASDNSGYRDIVNSWILKGYTLRYTGGMVPDVSQIFIKGHGIFSCCCSKNHKAKLRVLYEVACVGFLIEKAGGKTVTIGKIPISEYQIKTYDDRIPFGVGSAEQVDNLSALF